MPARPSLVASGMHLDPTRPGVGQTWVSLTGGDVAIIYAGEISRAARFSGWIHHIRDLETFCAFIECLIACSEEIRPPDVENVWVITHCIDAAVGPTAASLLATLRRILSRQAAVRRIYANRPDSQAGRPDGRGLPMSCTAPAIAPASPEHQLKGAEQ